ncbi:MAG: ABC transporter permease [Deltaproteobacteria bacterium]|nr:MAG: ABC transporter permease [Deltaproteobacteria bacterium]TMQ24766.1 MAG: ABC transporter permease [Deltaproteobacteria bacterium]
MLIPTLRKEIQLLRRDPRVLVRLIVLPVLFIAIFGYVFNTDNSKQHEARPITVWNGAGGNGELITRALDASQMFAVVPAATARAVEDQVAGHQTAVGLIVPPDFDPMHGHPATLLLDPREPPQVAGPLRGAVVGVVTRAVLREAALPDVVAVRAPIGATSTLDELSSAFQLTVPGNAVLFGFFIALTCALSFAEERRSGTWRRLLASPVSTWQLLFAKLVPYIALGTLQVGLLFAIGAFGFGMPIGGSLPALAVLTVGVACSATALGLLIASLSSTEKQISSLGSVLIMIMGLVGGAMFPRALMPHVMQQVGLFVPHGWALDGYYQLIVGKGTGFADVAKPIAAVYGFAVLFTVIGVRRFRFDQ